MKKFYLHIGLPKTGTSYLQATFAKNEFIYKRNGLLYPDLSCDNKLASKGNTTSGNGLDLAKKTVTALKSEYSSFDEISFFKTLDPAYDYLISSEWLIDMPLKKIREFAQLAYPTHEIHLICFFRSIPELVNSNYLQALKAGFVQGEFLDALALMKEETKCHIKKLISICQSEINHTVFNYNCCKDLIEVVDELIFGRKLSVPCSVTPINPSPDFHQIKILRLLADLCISNFELNMQYIEKSGGKSKGDFLIDKASAESIEIEFKDDIVELNKISFAGHHYIYFENLKKNDEKLLIFNFTLEDINHIKSSIEIGYIKNFTDNILWIKQFLKSPKLPGIPEDFDSISYLGINSDLIIAKVDPQQHYLEYGRFEGRQYKL